MSEVLENEIIENEENVTGETVVVEEAVPEAVVENKMGVKPINKLLLEMSVHMMISMIIQALYNIVDSIFVARLSENALVAVSLAFPVQQVMIAMGVGLGVGVNALLSRALGAKEYDKVNKIATNGIFFSACNFVIFFLIGIFAVIPFYVLSATDPEIIQYGVDYLAIVCCASFGMCAQFIFERLLQSTGRTVCTMITQSTGAIINIILDPILIFGLAGAPKMGIKGAAIATVLGQIVAAIFAFILNLKLNNEVNISMKGFKPSGKIFKEVYSIGFPSIIMQSIGSVMTACLNQILMGFSATAVAVLGIYFKLQSFVFMPLFGLNNGMVPIIGFNYGARIKDRVVKTIKVTMGYAFAIMSIGTLLFWIFPKPLMSLFSASEEMLGMGVTALRTISIHFPVAAFCIIIGSVLQALGKATYSLITSIMRQIVVLLPAAYLLSLTGNVNNVWWAFPIAEVMSLMASTFFFVKVKKQIIDKI